MKNKSDIYTFTNNNYTFKLNRAKKNITVQDIAESVNISASTVSRALNNHPKISQSTKEKVWKSAKQMGYLPNIPVYMRKQKNNIVVFLVDDLQKPTNHDTINSAHEYLIKKGYRPLIKFLTAYDQFDEFFFDMLHNIDVIGVISLLGHNQVLEKKHQLVVDSKFPLVVVNKSNSEIPNANILPDIYNGAYLAVDHLLKRGAKNVVLVTGNMGSSFYGDLQNGFNAASKSISKTHFRIIECDLNYKALKYEFEQLIDKKIPFDGIIACNGYIAQQLYNFLNSKSINVPDEVMLVGFGNEELNDFRPSKISTIEYSSVNMGLMAAKKIEKAIKKEPIENRLVIEPVKLIIRSSSMRVL
ncbi:hypothetical protein MNBD_BACTEROID03-1781 [hydrothermal vent metagenome]|uniref:HTH lacI-type domain-containing protein n=1 Tax=hydrothermal vent metagenome TaxID=652676 RepID=A0A3B0SVZ8_9ZZZZ